MLAGGKVNNRKTYDPSEHSITSVVSDVKDDTVQGPLFGMYHRLRGSASPVLTATGFVNGKGQFSTPTKSTPLNRSPKNLSQVITSATPTAQPN